MKTAQHVACVAEEPLKRQDQRRAAHTRLSMRQLPDAGLDSIFELIVGSNYGVPIFGQKMCALLSRRAAIKSKAFAFLSRMRRQLELIVSSSICIDRLCLF